MDLFMNQSNYIPWKGYFDNIADADVFVIYDHVQYTRHDWRNRNLIKVATGTQWLTVPVVAKGYLKKINETVVADGDWQKKHLSKLKNIYAKAACFMEVIDWVEELYLTLDSYNLSDINIHFLQKICAFLNINTTFIKSTDFKNIEGDRNGNILNICKALNIKKYNVGPAAKNYIDENLFLENGINIEFIDYSGYPEYPQLFTPFEHSVSILDLIFNCGKNAITYMKHTKKNP